MTTYLVGIDGSDHGAAALDWARGVATDADAVIAIHAWNAPVVTSVEASLVVDPGDAEAIAARFVSETVAALDDPRVDGRTVEGPAGRALVEVGESLGEDVTIVVGHGGSGKMSLLLGSTANHVVHHARQPVVVVRGEARLPVRRVVVGVDEPGRGDQPDEHSVAALRWALQLPGVATVEPSHADFVPAVVAGPVVEPGLESDEEVAEDDADLRAAIAAATDGTGTAPSGAEIVPRILAGTGAFALIEASREVDLVVVGTRGRSGFVELVTGSTTLEVLAHAHCPVAVVR
jgi:nucleotide-binding universal stress UspA family protein